MTWVVWTFIIIAVLLVAATVYLFLAYARAARLVSEIMKEMDDEPKRGPWG